MRSSLLAAIGLAFTFNAQATGADPTPAIDEMLLSTAALSDGELANLRGGIRFSAGQGFVCPLAHMSSNRALLKDSILSQSERTEADAKGH